MCFLVLLLNSSNYKLVLQPKMQMQDADAMQLLDAVRPKRGREAGRKGGRDGRRGKCAVIWHVAKFY